MTRPNTLYYITVGLVVCAVTLFTLTWGAIPFNEVLNDLLARWSGNGDVWNPLLHERLPRLLVLVFTGASLAVSGAVMQSLFQNPLASPGILGISAGGSLAALAILVMGWHITYPMALPIAAVSGCLITLLLIYTLSQKCGILHMHHLILIGVALSTALIAIQGAIIYSLRDHWQLIQTVTEWSAGSSHDRSWQHVNMQLPLVLVGLWGCWHYRQEINILALGCEEARNLGVNVNKVRWLLFLYVSLLTGGAMAALGTITFFALILPHVIRKLYGPDNRQLIPLCTVWGAITLATLDLLLRITQLYWLSIGNVSAVLGGVFFVTLLFGQLRQPQAQGTGS